MRRKLGKEILRALSRFNGNIIHLTHTDLDAVCCDAIFRRKYGDVLTIFSSVQDYSSYLDLFAQVQKATNLTLCLSDLGGREGAVESVARLKRNGWRIEWRDHHVWDVRVFKDVTRTIDYLCVNRELCACELACKDLLESDPIAQEIAAIGRDRDFWVNKDRRSDVLSTAISDTASREKLASKMSRGIFTDAEIEGMYTVQMDRKNKVMNNALRQSALFDHTAVTISRGYSSDVAAMLRDRYQSRTELLLRANGVFSVRTVAPVSNQIAMLFDGGGHPHAAGGNLHFTIAEKVGLRLFAYRLKKVRELIEAASRFDQS
ncbi:MAG: phosphoesterase [Halobacteriota archaeon]|jgi:oligoribonuclease NrnB/cAMP/cGMP phosphodiesterase (DHH superfamily)